MYNLLSNEYLRRSAAYCNVLLWRTTTPLTRRYGAGSPDAAPPTPSSLPPSPRSLDLAFGSPTGTRPAAHHFTIHPKVGIELDKSKHIVSKTQEMEDSTNR